MNGIVIVFSCAPAPIAEIASARNGTINLFIFLLPLFPFIEYVSGPHGFRKRLDRPDFKGQRNGDSFVPDGIPGTSIDSGGPIVRRTGIARAPTHRRPG